MTLPSSPPAGVEPELAHQRRIGPYRLERVLGTGGMGTVYLAVRDDDHFRKHVALKLMRSELRAPELRVRFRGERQILALLNHPNIAALVDGGETETGQLYEVMEYVSGCPIDAYCREHQLTIRERLRLFLEVCSAVSHAHRYLVVHRDIKPDNVFVTTEGVVKLLDFGIAKILRPELFDLPDHATRSAFAPCTPLYASPEQVRNLPVSTASDVYALGVLLFELLTGGVPYAESRQTEASLAAAICEDDPVTPSSRARTESERSEIEGDLDNIILMALRKEPDRRYVSVDHLASDIKRHLEGFPVRARGNSARYRLMKFIRRNSVPVAAAALVTFVLAAAGLATFRMAAQARRERDTAQAVAHFMASIFHENDPGQAKGRALSAKDVLERGILRIDTDLAGRPEVQGTLFHIAGRTLRHMGELDRGRDLMDRSLRIRRSLFRKEQGDVAETLLDLGKLNIVAGRYKEGASQLEEALAVFAKAKGDQSLDAARAKSGLGLAYYYLWRLSEARAVLESGMAALQGLGKDISDETYRRTLHNLTLVWEQEGSNDLAEAGMRKLLEADRKTLGDHPDIVLSLASLGYFLTKAGKAADAEPFLREAEQMHVRVFPGGAVSLGHIFQYQAMCLARLGKFTEAEAKWREAIPIHIKYLGEMNRFVSTDWIEYGSLERRRGDFVKAEKLIRKGLELRLRLRAGGPDNQAVSQARHYLGHVFRDSKRFADAAREYREVVRIQRAVSPNNRGALRIALLDLAKALESAGEGEAAKPFREEAEGLAPALSPGVTQTAANR